MTIIQPYKTNFDKFTILASILLVVLVVTASISILLYNGLVSLRHDISDGTANLNKIQVENAEWKNSLYKMLDPKNLAGLSSSRSLVLDKNPRYFENSGEVASSGKTEVLASRP